MRRRLTGGLTRDMPSKAATRIADVARLVGVSTATVSRALTHPLKVSVATRTRVLDAVRATGYTPDVTAQSLRTRRTMMVLVIVPDIANPFFSEVLRGVDEMLSAADYGLIIGNLGGSLEKEARFVDLAFSRQVDGVVLLSGRIPATPKGTMREAGVPLVAACEVILDAGSDSDLTQIEVGNEDATRLAVDYLLALGHRRFGYISGPPANVLDVARRGGVMAALAACPDGHPLFVMQGDFSDASGSAAAVQFLALKPALRPTAIQAANDEMAIGFMQTVQAAGMRIPRDVSVIGFDDIAFAKYYAPALTTVRQPRHLLGERAALALLAAMRGEAKSPSERLPTELCVRDSTGPVRR